MKRRTFIQTSGAVCLPSFDPGLLTSKLLTAIGRSQKPGKKIIPAVVIMG